MITSAEQLDSMLEELEDVKKKRDDYHKLWMDAIDRLKKVNDKHEEAAEAAAYYQSLYNLANCAATTEREKRKELENKLKEAEEKTSHIHADITRDIVFVRQAQADLQSRIKRNEDRIKSQSKEIRHYKNLVENSVKTPPSQTDMEARWRRVEEMKADASDEAIIIQHRNELHRLYTMILREECRAASCRHTDEHRCAQALTQAVFAQRYFDNHINSIGDEA